MFDPMKSLFLPVCSRSLVIIAVCALFGATAFGQAPATPAPGATPPAPAEKPKPLASGDSMYVRNSLKSLAYLGQVADAGKSLTDLAQARVRDDVSKSFAQARAALTKIAEAHGEKVAADVTGPEKTDLDRVTKAFAKPDKVDPNKPVKEWAAALAKESKRLDEKTKEAEKTTQDVDLKTFITNYGPGIRSAYTSVDALDKQLKKAK
jgi:hypothetical protein